MKIGILGSGKGSNFEAILKSIKAGRLGAEISVVISDCPNSLILEKARANHLPAFYISPGQRKTFLEPSVEEQYVQCLKDHGTDYVALAGFMRVIKDRFFKEYREKILNIHPSLLPSFRGLEAWKQALDCGVKVTGCTVHFVDEGLDTGPIVLQEAVPVLDTDTYESLHQRIHAAEHRIYPQALQLIAEHRLQLKDRRVFIRIEG